MMERSETLAAAAAPEREISGSYIDLPAILAGAVIATAIIGLFTTFGAAIGLSTISAKPGEGSFDAWMVVTAIWLVLTVVLGFLAGGYVTGRMRRRVDAAKADEVAARDGINGLVVWGLGLLLSAWIAAGVVSQTSNAVGSAVEAAGSVVGGTAGGLAQGIGSAASGIAGAAGQAMDGSGQDGGALSYLSDTLMRPVIRGAGQTDGTATPGAPATDTAELARQSGIVLGNVLKTGEISDEDRQFLVDATAQRTGLSQDEVNARVDRAVEGVQEMRATAEKAVADAKQQAIDLAETARISAILSAFLVTAAALVAAAAAMIGAVRGGHHRDEGRIFGGLSYRIRT